MATETRAKRRKRSLDSLAAMVPQKKARNVLSTFGMTPKPAIPETITACPLIHTLRQYGLLESIVSCLNPSDLLALALSCKSNYSALFPRPESLGNLLSRMPCCGIGVTIRRRTHHKSTFFYAYQCTEFAQCRTTSGRQNIAEQPCVTCKVTTCDECRIHCVYQSIYETPSDPDDLPNFSGFVLLDPFECAILSPHHLSPEDTTLPRWQERASNVAAGPYHDHGFLDMPLEVDQPGTPEKISDVLDVDLGLNSLTTWSGNSQFGFPSPVLQSLCDVAEQRKLFLCECCFNEAPQGYTALKPQLPQLPWLTSNKTHEVLKECHCSLRSHVLDRWQCVKCYESEESTIKDVSTLAPRSDPRQCRCSGNAQRIVCMWCWGEISEGRENYERLYAEHYAHIRTEQGWVPGEE